MPDQHGNFQGVRLVYQKRECMRTMRRQEIVPLVNRTCRPIEALDDGIVLTVKPGYRKTPDGRIVGAGAHGEPEPEYVPIATANRAMDQNKARGTVNPDDVLDCVFLLGVKGRDDISYVEDNADPDAELFDRTMLPEAAAAQRISTGVGRRRARTPEYGIDSRRGAPVGDFDTGVVRQG